ncbi:MULTISPECIES: restriction endonuclease subunit S [unclassified Psychrobacter]|uniref:restriction endonuclease subunit S n=1 Tax=unclassified Psychrobacter TaxID=196806 RepID=UPI0025CD559A|nr:MULTISPECIES: restriction endonuclease subunit S [unclassified Psychrobacter]
MVPNGWKTLSLGEITKEKISYGIVQAGPHVEDGVPYIKSSNVGGEIKIEDLQRTSSEIHHKYRRSAVHPNDIVFSLRGNIGRTSIVPPELLEANLTQGTARISVNTKNETNFIYYSLASTPILNRINSLSKGSTFKEISLEELRKVKLPIPPLSEQQKIAKILSTWDNAISTTERLIDNSTQQKKALMQQLLTGKKRLLDESGKPFAGEWESRLFKNILKLDRGSSPRPIVKYMTDSEDGVNWIKIGDTKGEGLYINSTKERITKEGAEKSRKVFKGEVVLSNSMSYGKPYILNIDGYIHDGWFVIRKFEKNIDVNFLIQILSSELIQRQYKRLAAGGVVSNISSELVYAVKINLPSIPEQQKIATVLTNADKEIELLKQQLADLQQEKKALMQVLLTGKKRVVDDD